MFDLGGGELLLIGIVALVVVGPKDLPKVFHAIGQVTGKARGMAREFTQAMNAAAKESGVDDLNKTLRGVANPKSYAMDKLRDASGLKVSTPVKPVIKPGGETEKLKAERDAARIELEKATVQAAADRRAAGTPPPVLPMPVASDPELEHEPEPDETGKPGDTA